MQLFLTFNPIRQLFFFFPFITFKNFTKIFSIHNCFFSRFFSCSLNIVILGCTNAISSTGNHSSYGLILSFNSFCFRVCVLSNFKASLVLTAKFLRLFTFQPSDGITFALAVRYALTQFHRILFPAERPSMCSAFFARASHAYGPLHHIESQSRN